MKPIAVIVNTCRGPVIDEVALTKTLADNKIFGAGLDVFDQEPPPPDNPLFKLNNVLLEPRISPGRPGTITRRASATPSTTCRRVARGEKPPLWVVPELVGAGADSGAAPVTGTSSTSARSCAGNERIGQRLRANGEEPASAAGPNSSVHLQQG